MPVVPLEAAPLVKHAGPEILDRLEPLLRQLRARSMLKEKSRGVFYLRGRAFLHFHEDGGRPYADIRLRDDFERFPASSSTERKALLGAVDQAIGPSGIVA